MAGERDETGQGRRFRAADVLTGAIDRRQPAGRARKQISAQLEPEQLRLLGELHARLNATATRRIEKSDLVGLGIELLAAVVAEGERDPASDDNGRAGTAAPIRDLEELRAYLRMHVRALERTR
jgi:hypothetical protein